MRAGTSASAGQAESANVEGELRRQRAFWLFVSALGVSIIVVSAILTGIFAGERVSAAERARQVLVTELNGLVAAQKSFIADRVNGLHVRSGVILLTLELAQVLNRNVTTRSVPDDVREHMSHVGCADIQATLNRDFQVRLLNATGYEVVRHELNATGGCFAVPPAQLQDKSDRPYVQRTLASDAGETHLSPINLNREFGQVERPLRPTIRSCRAVATAQGKLGMVAVNFGFNDTLADMEASFAVAKTQAIDLGFSDGSGALVLTDESGQYLLGPAPQAAWGWEFGTEGLGYSLAADNPTWYAEAQRQLQPLLEALEQRSLQPAPEAVRGAVAEDKEPAASTRAVVVDDGSRRNEDGLAAVAVAAGLVLGASNHYILLASLPVVPAPLPPGWYVTAVVLGAFLCVLLAAAFVWAVDRQQARARLAETRLAARARRVFLRSIFHDVRVPAQGLILGMDLLLDNLNSAVEAEEERSATARHPNDDKSTTTTTNNNNNSSSSSSLQLAALQDATARQHPPPASSSAGSLSEGVGGPSGNASSGVANDGTSPRAQLVQSAVTVRAPSGKGREWDPRADLHSLLRHPNGTRSVDRAATTSTGSSAADSAAPLLQALSLVNSLRSSATNMVGVLNTALDLDRLDAGAQVASPGWFAPLRTTHGIAWGMQGLLAPRDLCAVVDGTCTLSPPSSHAATPGGLGPLEVPLAACQVFADRELLSRCISNLASNAVRFSPTGGAITLTCDVNAVSQLWAVGPGGRILFPTGIADAHGNQSNRGGASGRLGVRGSASSSSSGADVVVVHTSTDDAPSSSSSLALCGNSDGAASVPASVPEAFADVATRVRTVLSEASRHSSSSAAAASSSRQWQLCPASNSDLARRQRSPDPATPHGRGPKASQVGLPVLPAAFANGTGLCIQAAQRSVATAMSKQQAVAAMLSAQLRSSASTTASRAKRRLASSSGSAPMTDADEACCHALARDLSRRSTLASAWRPATIQAARDLPGAPTWPLEGPMSATHTTAAGAATAAAAAAATSERDLTAAGLRLPRWWMLGRERVNAGLQLHGRRGELRALRSAGIAAPPPVSWGACAVHPEAAAEQPSARPVGPAAQIDDHTAPEAAVTAALEGYVLARAVMVLGVTDSGPGITAEDQTALFEGLSRNSARDSGDARYGARSGLGLSIARRVVKLHGGCIGAAARHEASLQPGQRSGTCMFAVLPTLVRVPLAALALATPASRLLAAATLHSSTASPAPSRSVHHAIDALLAARAHLEAQRHTSDEETSADGDDDDNDDDDAADNREGAKQAPSNDGVGRRSKPTSAKSSAAAVPSTASSSSSSSGGVSAAVAAGSGDETPAEHQHQQQQVPELPGASVVGDDALAMDPASILSAVSAPAGFSDGRGSGKVSRISSPTATGSAKTSNEVEADATGLAAASAAAASSAAFDAAGPPGPPGRGRRNRRSRGRGSTGDCSTAGDKERSRAERGKRRQARSQQRLVTSGTVQPEPEAGQGAASTATTPTSSASSAAAASASSAASVVAPQEAVRLCVLVVDDDDVIATSLSKSLRRAGVDVTVARDGQEAVEIVTAMMQLQRHAREGRRKPGSPTRFDAITMDMSMPRLGGVDATQAIRALGFGGLIIGCTGHSDAHSREVFSAAGANRTLVKPVTAADILAILQTQFPGRSRSASQ